MIDPLRPFFPIVVVVRGKWIVASVLIIGDAGAQPYVVLPTSVG
jgi:hypothetical protein